MNSLNLYETTGGARKHKKYASRKHKKHSSNKKSKRNNSKRNNSKRNNRRHQRGGGSDWITSQYSLGPINNPEHSVGPFSASSVTSQRDLANPPTMGLAGSGYSMSSLEGGNVRHIGAPIS